MIFPLYRFWTYSPLGFVCAIIWNFCEMIGVPRPAAPWMFGKIIGCKGKKQ